MFKLNVFIPKGLDVELLIRDVPPVGIKNFKVEKLKFIISKILEIPLNNPKIEMEDGFIPVSAKVLQRYFKDYNLYLEYLLKTGVLYSTRQYLEGKTRTYKFMGYGYPNLKEDSIESYSLLKKIISLKKKSEITLIKKGYKHLINWFNDGLEINTNAALEYISNDREYKNNNLDERDFTLKFNRSKKYKDPNIQYSHSFMNIIRLANKDFRMGVDNSGFRLHTNISCMKSNLKHFLTYEGEGLGACDLSNSQPYISTLLLRESFWKPNSNKLITINTPYIKSLFNPFYISIMLSKIPERIDNTDIYKFIDLVVKGKLYEYFAQKLHNDSSFVLENPKERKTIKDIMFNVLYSKNSTNNALKRLKTPFNVICISAIKPIVVGDRCKVDLVLRCSIYRLKYKIAGQMYPYYCFIICIDEVPP